MTRFFGLLALFVVLSGPVLAQGVPNSSTVVSACGGVSYVADQNRPNTQDTGGNTCTNGPSSVIDGNANATSAAYTRACLSVTGAGGVAPIVRNLIVQNCGSTVTSSHQNRGIYFSGYFSTHPLVENVKVIGMSASTTEIYIGIVQDAGSGISSPTPDAMNLRNVVVDNSGMTDGGSTNIAGIYAFGTTTGSGYPHTFGQWSNVTSLGPLYTHASVTSHELLLLDQFSDLQVTNYTGIGGRECIALGGAGAGEGTIRDRFTNFDCSGTADEVIEDNNNNGGGEDVFESGVIHDCQTNGGFIALDGSNTIGDKFVSVKDTCYADPSDHGLFEVPTIVSANRITNLTLNGVTLIPNSGSASGSFPLYPVEATDVKISASTFDLNGIASGNAAVFRDVNNLRDVGSLYKGLSGAETPIALTTDSGQTTDNLTFSAPQISYGSSSATEAFSRFGSGTLGAHVKTIGCANCINVSGILSGDYQSLYGDGTNPLYTALGTTAPGSLPAAAAGSSYTNTSLAYQPSHDDYTGAAWQPDGPPGYNANATTTGSITFTPGTDSNVQDFQAVSLTGNVTITLSTTGATKGLKWKVIAPGTFNADTFTVAGVSLTAAKQGIEFTYNGSAYVETGIGTAP